jgi:hypothetical protein
MVCDSYYHQILPSHAVGSMISISYLQHQNSLLYIWNLLQSEWEKLHHQVYISVHHQSNTALSLPLHAHSTPHLKVQTVVYLNVHLLRHFLPGMRTLCDCWNHDCNISVSTRSGQPVCDPGLVRQNSPVQFQTSSQTQRAASWQPKHRHIYPQHKGFAGLC